MLILAATPIGNLSDASPRLARALAEATLIAAEDTRSLRHLAQALGIKLQARLFSLHEHNERERIAELVELASESDLLLVSDAGMPTVSDPGFLLVQAAAEAGVEVSIIPGPSAVLSALAVSGLATDRFCFEGFLPRRPGARRAALKELGAETRTMIFFEAPHRLVESLADMALAFGSERRVAVVRELTKKFEQVRRGSLEEVIAWAKEGVRGEIVIVVAGSEPSETPEPEVLVGLVNELMATGLSRRDAVAKVASETGVGKSALYQESLKQGRPLK